jgi:hypothetical protein
MSWQGDFRKCARQPWRGVHDRQPLHEPALSACCGVLVDISFTLWAHLAGSGALTSACQARTACNRCCVVEPCPLPEASAARPGGSGSHGGPSRGRAEGNGVCGAPERWVRCAIEGNERRAVSLPTRLWHCSNSDCSGQQGLWRSSPSPDSAASQSPRLGRRPLLISPPHASFRCRRGDGGTLPPGALGGAAGAAAAACLPPAATAA